MRRLRLFGVIVALAVTATLFTVQPAQAAAVDYGLTEDFVQWVDTAPSPDVSYQLHFRIKVTEDATPSPDQWRVSMRAWCTRDNSVSTPCNFDMFNYALTNCGNSPANCGYPAIESTTGVNVMGSFGSKECNAPATECLVTGVWRDEEHAYTYINGAIDHLQARFTASSSQHLTNVYDMCSQAVSYGIHTTEFLSCGVLSAAP